MTYVYDANGNIVSKTPYTNVTSSDLSTATQGTAIVYGYGDSNWSDKLTSYNGQTISYDASGNPTSYRGETVTWNGRLMTSYTKDGCLYEYEYNSDGMRTIRRMYKNGELTSTIRYIWDGDVLLGTRMESVDSDETFLARYLYDDSGELYGMEYKGLENAGSGMFAFIKNLQGDIVSITPLDSESNVEVNMEYDAWGKPIIQQASSMTEGLLMAIMMMVTNVGYRGYFYDLETELYYLRSRYYDPEIGRFINADDTDYLAYDKSPISMNLFAYCENNPIKLMDKNGNMPLLLIYYGNFYNVFGRVSFIKGREQFDMLVDKYSVSANYSYSTGIISVDNAILNVQRIIENGMTLKLAELIRYVGTEVSDFTSFRGRTVTGVAFELLCHYIWYKKGILKSHTKQCDIGGTGRYDRDFDSNAVIFERNRNKFSEIQGYVKNKNLSKASIKIYGILLNVCASGVWSKVD